MQISTEPVWLLSLIVCCALVKSPNTNVRCRIVLHSTFLPSQKRLSTSITFAAINKFRRKLSRLRRMRFTTPRWRVLLYATSTLSAALLLHYQVHARIWRNLQLCWPNATMHQQNHCPIAVRYVKLFVWNCFILFQPITRGRRAGSRLTSRRPRMWWIIED